MLELDGPALEAVAVVPYLSHARYPDAHVQLEDRFLLKLDRLYALVVGALAERARRVHADGEEALLELLLLEVGVN